MATDAGQAPLSEAADAAGRAKHKAQRAAVEAEDHRATSWVESVGQSANGVVHMVIGGIALGVAFGAGGSADQSGALGGIEGPVGGGIALGAVGVAVVAPGWTSEQRPYRHDAEEAGGLDGALQSLTTVPGGVVALVAIAVGLIVYGVYCVARGIWAR